MVAHDIQPTEGARVPVRHIAIFARNMSCHVFRVLHYTYMTQYKRRSKFRSTVRLFLDTWSGFLF